MKQITINVLNRKETGSSAANRLRRAGKIPAILYGKSDPCHLTIERKAWSTIWKQASKEASLIEIENEGGDKVLSVIKDTQRDPITDQFLHVDFYEVAANETMTTPVPIHLLGEPFGVKNESAVLDIHLHEIEITCLPKDLPSAIELDVTELRADQSLYVRELPELEGVTYVASPETVVASCIGPRGKSSEDTDEGTEEAKDESAEEDKGQESTTDEKDTTPVSEKETAEKS